MLVSPKNPGSLGRGTLLMREVLATYTRNESWQDSPKVVYCCYWQHQLWGK